MKHAMNYAQAVDFLAMGHFARLHNLQCGKAIKNSDEDGKPYCRYNVRTSDSGIGENIYVVCVECGEERYCGVGVNL